ncbi:hypothetical protein BDZ90DRAFT_230860 [Jaminaea rosea]|uniref:Vacuolar membrane-associated protein IML1 n=1 Tax=Jaminaea rosea TaxID=1569628 RepID=A0A316UUD2_9BASI|nr:hypothetical protein BDZ90DRAFT_230860 [Jaminaea rosea]PWN28852.1 hypothetical protein BDZ90DRAFT_230860 [Jaminaea rosea]
MSRPAAMSPSVQRAPSTSASSRRSSSRHAAESRPVINSRLITLWTHEPPNFSSHEIVLSPELLAHFGVVGENDLLEVTFPPSVEPTWPTDSNGRKRRHGHFAHRSFVFRASQGIHDSSEAVSRSGQLQLSLARSIASVYGFHNRQEVLLSKVSREDNVISHVELYFRDQYVGRADMWRLTTLLDDTCVYVGQKIALAGSVRATVGRIFIREHKVTSGYVAPQTKAIFRSESAKYHLFFQFAKEMWDFDEDGELYYEKALTGFIPELLRRWRSVPTNHVLSIILFARVYYDEDELHMLDEAALPVQRERCENGRWYIDYYKVIVDLESRTDWKEVISMLKEECFRFQHDILLIGRPEAGPAGAPEQEEQHADLLRRDRALLAGKLSASHEGNILEAVNLALNPFDEHFIDRDLNRTGLDLVILTAGTGHFRVEKNLLRLTTERMSDNGIGLDLVCLTKMPLHSVPLFRFSSTVPPLSSGVPKRTPSRSAAPTASSSAAPPDPLYVDGGTGPLADFYSIPHWIDASFYNLQQDQPFRADRFVPRVKMREVQQIGYMENEISDISLPYLEVGKAAGGAPPGSLDDLASREQRRALRERFDRETFRDLEKTPRRPTTTPNRSVGSIDSPRSAGAELLSKTPKTPRFARAGRRPALESHPEDGEHGEDVVRSRPTSVVVSGSPSMMSPSSSFSSLRPASIRSVSTLNRPLRPLQPVGKAEAWVAPMETSAAGIHAPATMASSSLTRSRSYKLDARWLWNSLKGGKQEEREGSEPLQRERPPQMTTSGSAASLRIQALLKRSESPSRSLGRDHAPAPISIPSHASSTSSNNNNGSGPSNTSGSGKEGDSNAQGGGGSGSGGVGLGEDKASSHDSPEDEESRAARYAQRAKVEKQTLVNPSNPRKALSASSQLLRWQHLFPRRLNRHVVKWRSITTPACLPLTTLYLPTQHDLAENWAEYPHILSISSDLGSFLVKRSSSTSPALAALKEMTSQRLAQGFQFIVPAERSSQRRSSPFRLRHPSELFQPGTLTSGNPIVLGMSNQVHRLTYDRGAGAINVERYIRNKTYDLTPIEYSCCVWPRHLPGYQTVKATFRYPDYRSYDWTYLDSLVTGHAEEQTFTEGLRYWRTRFVIVPTGDRPPPMTATTGEQLDDEEIRLIGMDRLGDLFARARWRGARGTSSSSSTAAPLRFIPTSLDPSQCVHDAEFMRQAAAMAEDVRVASAKRLLSETSNEGIAEGIATGVPIEDRFWHRHSFQQVFTGAELTTWLVGEFKDVKTRDEAVEVGEKLRKQGVFEHVFNSHGFLDGHYFYYLRGRKRAAGAAPHQQKRKAASRAPRLLMSRSAIIDVDPARKSDRAETAFLHYDVSHNPANGFNAQLHWLGTTARFIEDTVQNWTRTLERYGLRLIEAPIGQICDVGQHNPFQAPVPIHLALPPPAAASYAHFLPPFTHAADYFEWALLKRFGFVLDQEAAGRYPQDVEFIYQSRPSRFEYSQFVHRTGIAFVQVVGGAQGFLWLNNRLFNSHLGVGGGSGGRQRRGGGGGGGGSAAVEIPDADRARREFEAFCSDPAALHAFYLEVLVGLQAASTAGGAGGAGGAQHAVTE